MWKKRKEKTLRETRDHVGVINRGYQVERTTDTKTKTVCSVGTNN